VTCTASRLSTVSGITLQQCANSCTSNTACRAFESYTSGCYLYNTCDTVFNGQRASAGYTL
jgi:hypothetical protein